MYISDMLIELSANQKSSVKAVGPLAPTSSCFDADSSVHFTPGAKWVQRKKRCLYKLQVLTLSLSAHVDVITSKPHFPSNKSQKNRSIIYDKRFL